MCIGIPLQITRIDRQGVAWCLQEGTEIAVNTELVGPQTVGTWLLTFLGTAREVLDEERARAIQQALEGLSAALSGQDYEHYFQDLIDREPQLPEHLRVQFEAQSDSQENKT